MGAEPSNTDAAGAFRAMILREFLLESRLTDEFRAARTLSWVWDHGPVLLAGRRHPLAP